jgi:Tol biopolymer transport system component
MAMRGELMSSRPAVRRQRGIQSGLTVACGLPFVSIAGCVAIVLVAWAVRADDKLAGDEATPGVGLILRALHFRDDVSDDFVQMVAVDPNTGECRRVYSVATLGNLSPDGRHIVYWKRSGDDAQEPLGIYVQDTEEDAPPKLILKREGYPSWSHGGQKVVVSVELREGKYETWRVNVDGTAPAKLSVPETDLVFNSSNDGIWLAARTLGGDPAHWGRLTLFHPDGTGHRALTSGSAAKDRFTIARMSPDARLVAYTEVTTRNDIRTSRVYIVDVDGKDLRQIPIPFEPHTTAEICWSPDGKRLAVGATQHTTRTTWIGVVDLERQTFRQLPVIVQAPAPLVITEAGVGAPKPGNPAIERWFLNIRDWR